MLARLLREETAPDYRVPERVLVVIMNNQRDWGLVQKEGWYRIPVKHAPRQVAADYLAFYQTRVFGEEKWSIRYYAPVKNIQVATRAELLPNESDHPRAQDIYYRFRLGRVRRLSRAVPSEKWRRITFIPTTMAHLLKAQDVRDLCEGRASAEQLWEALQATGIEATRSYEIQDSQVRYRTDLAVFCQRGSVGISCPASAWLNGEYRAVLAKHGWVLIRFNTRQLYNPWRCARLVREQVECYGGPAE